MANNTHLLLAFAGLILLLLRVSHEESVEIDLRQGIVEGYSNYVQFVQPPTAVSGRKCGVQAVIKIDFSGPFKVAKFQLEYDKPRLWTLDISDSAFGDGYGGDNGSTSNMAEIQIFNRQMRIYGNDLPGYLDATIDGGLLLKVVDDLVEDGNRVSIEINDEKVRWVERGQKQLIESKFLYTINGQNASYGSVDYAVYAGFNRVVAGNFRSGFGLCRATVTLKEGGVDECKTGLHDCSPDAVCFNTRRSFRCRCKPGFYGNGKICLDEDECEYENGGCVHHCDNTRGNFSCSCLDGFRLDRDGQNCQDVDECAVERGGCMHQCINTLGSFQCHCPNGYALNPDGRTCSGRSWCQDRRGCSHHCANTPQGVICACRNGYRLHADGKRCISTCLVGNGGCHHKCTDGTDGPICSCHAKYVLQDDGKTCTATCGVNNGGCDRRCKDTPNGTQCSCPPGYVLHGDMKNCLDIDECGSLNGGCSHGCVNTHGSYECICPRGFNVEQDHMTCTDINECDVNGTCDHACVNTPGSFYCECRLGYHIYATIHCADQDECSVNSGGCEHTCENSEGSYTCQCRPGYKLHTNGKDCVEVECLPLQPPAKSDTVCRREGRDTVCTIRCQGDAVMTYDADVDEVNFRCGRSTGFDWVNDLGNTTMPTCSEHVTAPTIRSKARFAFQATQCSSRKRVRQTFQQTLRQDLSDMFREERKLRCPELCEVDNVDLQCVRNRRRDHRASRRTSPSHVVRAEFELQIAPQETTERCDINCVQYRSNKRLKKTLKMLRKNINAERFFVRFEDQAYGVSKKSLKTFLLQNVCNRGQVLVNGKCVGCSIGTYYDETTDSCLLCAPGTYQDTESEVVCKMCPHGKMGVGMEGAQNATECNAQCEPGQFSSNGQKPCQLCPRGAYQPDYGRTSCRPCGSGITTSRPGATGFQECNAREVCVAGQYYEHSQDSCQPCPLHTYQPDSGQDFCVRCPGSTTTDRTGVVNSTYCKDRRCGGEIGTYQGFIQSPNWPGDYPHDVECVWNIAPQKGRRILVVIPEIFLASRDRCGDILVMRKSASPYSLTSYETCESTETPIAFTSRSKRLWIKFKTNRENSARGFSIPFVTYNEEYQDLIEDIVRDGRLYSSHQHQEVLKNRQLLSALLEVIAQPYNYFKYANVSRSMFPESFIRLLTPKVRRFFT